MSLPNICHANKELSGKDSEMVVHVGCHRNVSLLEQDHTQSGENKTATSVVLAAWQWEPRVGGGEGVNHGKKERNPRLSRCKGVGKV